MLQVLQPIWLFATAAVAIPLIIHLWNDRQGRTFPVGSVAFLEKRSRRKARSPRLTEWLLLLLRCLLLLVLALLLSGPFRKSRPQATSKIGWILLGDTALASGQYRTMIDSLVKAGYGRYELPRIQGAAGATGVMDSGAAEAAVSWWASFLAMDRRAPAGVPFYVFTDGRSVHFQGRRPSTDRKVNWYCSGDPDTMVKSRITGAWRSGPDSITVATLGSRSTGSSYRYHSEPDGGRRSVPMDGQASVAVDTTTLRIAIYADNKYINDGRYVAAGIQALQQFTRRNIRISIYDSMQAPHPDWLFWLSARPLPSGLATRPASSGLTGRAATSDPDAANVLLYQPGGEVPVDTWVEGMDVAVSRIVGAGQANDRDRSAGASEEEGQPGIPIWKDGFGRSLLTLEETSRGRIFHFYSHFDPAWNGLVWSSRFPAALETLLLEKGIFPGAPFVSGADDRRVLDPSQVAPRKRVNGKEDSLEGIAEDWNVAGGMLPDGRERRGMAGARPGLAEEVGRDMSGATEPDRATIDLAPACWLLALLLLAAERVVSYRNHKMASNG